MALQNVSFFGTVVTIVASATFPAGFQVTQFADDADPLDAPAVKIGDGAMGINGDFITWSKPVALPMVLNVIPGSQDDENLTILANAIRVSKGKAIIPNTITATVVYPDGTATTLINGILTDAPPPAKSGSSGGRYKTRTFSFLFQDSI